MGSGVRGSNTAKGSTAIGMALLKGEDGRMGRE